MELVEREADLHQLRLALTAAAERGQVALVAGEAGIGKTSLLRTLAATHGAVWWGACDALQTPHPLAPLLDIARETGARFATALAGPRPALFEAVLGELRAAATPLLMVIEDAHWADDATLDLVKFLGRRIERTRALLVVSFRDDEVGATHALRRVIGELPPTAQLRIELPRLTQAGVETLARAALRSPDGLFAATHGNPFFVTELLRHPIDQVPRSVQDLVLARYARLDAPAQAIARLVSIVPSQIERWLVDELLGPQLVELGACLDSGLLVADAATLGFRHELARQAVEASIALPHAQGLHAQVLAACSARTSEIVPLARLVHHAAHAGDAAAVMRFAPEAARQAAAQGAHREAAAHYATALAHVRSLDEQRHAELLDARAYECYLVGDIEQAIAAREAAMRLWRGLQRPLREGDNLRWLSRLHWFLGHQVQADTHASEAVRVLEALPPSNELAMAYSNKAHLHALAEETPLAVQWGERAITLAERLGNVEVVAHALNNVGTARLLHGEAEGAQQLERSLALALEHGLEEHAARAYCNLASGAVKARDYARAARPLDAGIRYSLDHDLDAWSLYLLAWRAQLHLEQGRWNEAADDAEALLARRGVPAITRIPALAALGRLRARRGDPGADPLLDEALATALPTGELQRVWPVAVARAEAAWLDGDAGRCAIEARRGLDLALQRDNRWAIGDTAFWLWRADALGGRELAGLIDRCAEPYALQMQGCWQEAAAAWAALGCPFDRALALLDGDETAKREALAIFERLGARPAADTLRARLRAVGVRGLARGPRASTRERAFGLTTRELEVLRLLCEGMRNAEIAVRLHRSVRTVDHHLAAVFAKLGVDSRTAALAAAQREGLAPQSGQARRAK
jgi:DNA-binding CsgD family transcriptional regulator/tetratricopeptide (TPR) repeat protein